MKKINGNAVLAFDLGTGGITGLVIQVADGTVVAKATAEYPMVIGLPDGHMEQRPSDWLEAVKAVMANLHGQVDMIDSIVCIGIAGQMHGEVVINSHNEVWPTARLWCDGRNANEGAELTDLFQTKIPARMTIARLLWTMRNQPDKLAACKYVTTPAGFLSYVLTGVNCLGIGEASGMFPINPETVNYRSDLVDAFSTRFNFPSIQQLLPKVFLAGTFPAGLNEHGASLLGLSIGTPVAPVEGDQPACLTGSFISEPGSLAYSFGTSTCGNLISDIPFQGIYQPIDYFLDPIGRYVRMIWTRNGTTLVNVVMELFRQARGDTKVGETFKTLMPLAFNAAKDCDGLLGLPFIGIEPGMGFTENGIPAILGMTSDNFTVGNLIHMSFVLSVFGLKNGLEVLKQQDIKPKEIVVTGGATKDEEYIAQLIADVTATPVRVTREANEGTAYGAGLLAMFAWQNENHPATLTYGGFLKYMLGDEAGNQYAPIVSNAGIYSEMYKKYTGLMPVEELLLKS